MNNLLDFKSFFKFLSRNSAYTAIDVFGLSVSLMFVILIAVYTVQEVSTDKFQEKGDRIYLLTNEHNGGSAYRLAQHVKDRYPEVEMICPTALFTDQATAVKDQTMNADVLLADSTFFDMFSFGLIEGTSGQVLSGKSYAVVSETFANSAFGGRSPIGESLRIRDSVLVTVSGIMKDIKNSVIPTCDVLIRMDNVKYFNAGMDSESFSNSGAACLFFQLQSAGALDGKLEDMAAWFKTFFWLYQDGFVQKANLIPLNELYFTSLVSTAFLNRGDWKFVMVLMSVGILILLFAIINYINLTVAQTGFRAKEMATRRLLGSSRAELFTRLIMESTLLSFLSFGLGLLLAFAVVPATNALLETQIDLLGAVSPATVLSALGLILLLGCLSGLLPAIIISNTKPIEVVRGTFRARTKMVFSKFFITFQNAITIVLIAASITMVAQSYHLIHAPLGYNTTNILEMDVWKMEDSQRTAFVGEVSSLPGVKRVALSRGIPFDLGNNWSGTFDGKNISFQLFIGDQAYFDMLGIKILRDNQVASEDAYYLTQYAFKELGLPEDTPSFKYGETTIAVAGMVQDFQLNNITYEKRPVMMQLRKMDDMEPWSVLVEVEGDPYVAKDRVKEVYERLSHLDFKGEYLDEQIQKSFASQKRLTKIVSIFSAIAVLISLLGLIAMSTYFIQQRAQEVAVRKVFGATSGEMLSKLVRTFLNYVVIAFFLSIPLIWYFMDRWLSDYSYRIGLSPLIFIASGAFCLLVSFATVFIQSYIAANANPIEGVKDKS